MSKFLFLLKYRWFLIKGVLEIHLMTQDTPSD